MTTLSFNVFRLASRDAGGMDIRLQGMQTGERYAYYKMRTICVLHDANDTRIARRVRFSCVLHGGPPHTSTECVLDQNAKQATAKITRTPIITTTTTTNTSRILFLYSVRCTSKSLVET